MSETKLLRCPFCGGEAVIKTEYTSYFSIGCSCKECHAKTVRYCPEIKKEDALDRIEECKEEAIKAWNTRKPMQNIVERLEAENYIKDGGELFLSNNLEDCIPLRKAIEIVTEEGGV